MHDGLLEVTVSRTWHLATGYRAVELTAKENAPLPPFDDGAILDVILDARANRTRSRPLYRDASASGRYVVGVRTETPGDSRKESHDDAIFRSGSELLIRPPQNLPLDIDRHARYLLFAAGLGVTTIAGIAKRLADAGAAFELHHFAQSADRSLWRPELRALAAHGQIHHRVGLSVDEIDRAVSHALSPSGASAHVYLSGPPRLMDLIQRNAREWVYPRNVHRIHLGERLA
jgi:ferredoxin-NADP reductase